MKIVINSKYGGFGLSVQAKKHLLEFGCEHIELIAPNEYYGNKLGWEKEFERDVKFLEFAIHNDGRIILSLHEEDYRHRSCKLLVRTVLELGSEADGDSALLKIVDIPDDIDWVIEEYDGSEWVSEKHRTWS